MLFGKCNVVPAAAEIKITVGTKVSCFAFALYPRVSVAVALVRKKYTRFSVDSARVAWLAGVSYPAIILL